MPLQILFVDDSVTMHRAMQITFSREDAQVSCATDAAGALARAREMRPDVILIDVTLTQSDGYTVCQELKSIPDLAQVPVMLLANKQNPIDEAKVEACGAKGHGIKPFETQAMVDRVRALANLPPSAASVPRTTRPTVQTPAAQPQPQPQQAAPQAPVAAQPTPKPAPAPQPTAVATPTLPPAPARPTPTAAPAASPAQQQRPVAPQPAGGWSVTPVPAQSAPPAGPPRTPPARPAVVSGAPPAAFHAPPAAPRQTAGGPPRSAPGGMAGVARDAAHAAAQSVGQAVHKAGLPVDQAALMSMAREIIERVAWEVIPELAETMIREQLARQQKL